MSSLDDHKAKIEPRATKIMQLPQIAMRFFANNPPSILILGGILGWILCGATNIVIFCNWWLIILGTGVVLQVLWLLLKHRILG